MPSKYRASPCLQIGLLMSLYNYRSKSQRVALKKAESLYAAREMREQIFEALNNVMGWKKPRCQQWYTTPHNWFDGKTPHQMVLKRKGVAVIKFIYSCKVG